jgi:hypothetical protein
MTAAGYDHSSFSRVVVQGTCSLRFALVATSVGCLDENRLAALETIVGDRNRAQKHVARARIILGSADLPPQVH